MSLNKKKKKTENNLYFYRIISLFQDLHEMLPGIRGV